VTFQQSVKTCLNKYIDIEGRAARSEYWWFALFGIILTIVASVIDAVIGLPIFYFIASLAILAPSIAVSVRRLHDRDMVGWWILLFLVPFIGAIALLILFVMRGTDGPNRFGPDPLG
jgi:uncharacterized membrane protein YhaH (DUF805 family)